MFTVLIINSLPLIFLNFELIFDLQKSYKNTTEFFLSFTQLSLMLTS